MSEKDKHVIKDMETVDVILSYNFAFGPDLEYPRNEAVNRIVMNCLYNIQKDDGCSIEEICKELKEKSPVSFRYNTIHKSIQCLKKNGVISSQKYNGRDHFLLKDRYKLIIETQIRDRKALLDKCVKKIIDSVKINYALVTVSQVGIISKLFTDFIVFVFSKFGFQCAKMITGNISDRDFMNSSQIREELDRKISHYHLNETEVASTIKSEFYKFFREPDPDYEALKFYMAQNFYVLKLLGLDPKAHILSKGAFSGSHMYLDSNVIITALLSESRPYRSFKEFYTGPFLLNFRTGDFDAVQPGRLIHVNRMLLGGIASSTRRTAVASKILFFTLLIAALRPEKNGFQPISEKRFKNNFFSVFRTSPELLESFFKSESPVLQTLFGYDPVSPDLERVYRQTLIQIDGLGLLAYPLSRQLSAREIYKKQAAVFPHVEFGTQILQYQDLIRRAVQQGKAPDAESADRQFNRDGFNPFKLQLLREAIAQQGKNLFVPKTYVILNTDGSERERIENAQLFSEVPDAVRQAASQEARSEVRRVNVHENVAEGSLSQIKPDSQSPQTGVESRERLIPLRNELIQTTKPSGSFIERDEAQGEAVSAAVASKVAPLLKPRINIVNVTLDEDVIGQLILAYRTNQANLQSALMTEVNVQRYQNFEAFKDRLGHTDDGLKRSYAVAIIVPDGLNEQLGRDFFEGYLTGIQNSASQLLARGLKGGFIGSVKAKGIHLSLGFNPSRGPILFGDEQAKIPLAYLSESESQKSSGEFSPLIFDLLGLQRKDLFESLIQNSEKIKLLGELLGRSQIHLADLLETEEYRQMPESPLKAEKLKADLLKRLSLDQVHSQDFFSNIQNTSGLLEINLDYVIQNLLSGELARAEVRKAA